MINNALLDKWEEIYGKKKEEPAPVENKIEYELHSDFVERLKDVNTTLSLGTINIGTGITGTGITASNFVSISNSSVSYKPIKTYDPHSTLDAFMQVADKVKDGTAKVISVTMEMDTIGSFAAFKELINQLQQSPGIIYCPDILELCEVLKND